MGKKIKVYSNLNFVNNNDGQAKKITIYVKNGIIDEISYNPPENGVEFIDCNNAFLIPGFVDGHGHMTHLGKNRFEVDLSSCKSEEDAIDKIDEFYKQNKSLKCILGGGWNQENWKPKSLPNNKKLSLKFPDIPVIMTRVDAHAVWVNKKGMELAKIDTNTSPPDGGEILIDDNQVTGILVDKAQSLIKNIIPNETIEDVKNWILEAQKICLSQGITEIHDAGINNIQYQAYLSLVKEDKLKIRVYAMANQELFEKGVNITNKNLFELRSVKLVSDGALGSRGAALIENYSDYETKGILILDRNKLKNLLKKAFDQNFQVCVHAIGDKANRELINAVEDVKESKSLPSDHRTRIEHAQIIKKDDLKRIFNNNIIASIQPVHCISDMYMAEDRLGSRIDDAYLWATLLDNKIKIMGGSDFPVEDCSPLIGIHAAVNRQKINYLPVDGWKPKEKLNIKEAVNMFTKHTAFGSFKENIKGEVLEGYMADFTLIDQNIFNLDHSKILNIKIMGTVVDGDLVYSTF